MKKQILVAAAFLFLVIGCKKETPGQTEPGSKVITAADGIALDDPSTVCYLYNKDGSIIMMQLTFSEGNAVSGDLTYAFKEKDRNHGVFTGQIKDSIMIADYEFHSEGIETTRQVAFQFKDGQLIEGYGETTEDGTKFKDVSKLKFDSKMPLEKTVCSK